MKEGFRQSMAWLHTWGGLLVGWILFFIFLTGTLGYVKYEIDRWMTPEAPMVSNIPPHEELYLPALEKLSRLAPNARFWEINLPGGRTPVNYSIHWRTTPKEDGQSESHVIKMDYITGEELPSVRETGGGDALYKMHYRLHYMDRTTAYILVGICSMFMLIAIISGTIIHKKIFKDFFTFRPAKGQRSWLDGHNILSVLPLPFHLMITYSGLVFLMFTYMPLGPEIIYGNEKGRSFFNNALGLVESGEKMTVTTKQMAPITGMVEYAEQQWGENNVKEVYIKNPNKSNALVTLYAYQNTIVERNKDSIIFNAFTGKPMIISERGGSAVTNRVLVGLHEGNFAGPVLRFLYVLAGISGVAMIGTGLLLWSTKRKLKLIKSGKIHLGIHIVDRLNLGTIIGLPIGIGLYFWANRLIPVGIEGRAAMEINVIFITWATLLIYPIWRPLEKAWVEMLYLAVGVFGLIPILNFITTDRHLGITIPHGDWVLAGFDMSMLIVALFFTLLARNMVKKANYKIARENNDRHPALKSELAE